MFVSNRTFLVDEEIGAVNIFCLFEDNGAGMPDSHTFRLEKGKYRFIHTLSVNRNDKPVEVPEYKPEPDPVCDRNMLKAATASYILAQESGDLSKMALADKVKYLENMTETTKEKGMWNTPLKIAFHRSIYDTVRCKSFTEVIVTEGKEKYVLGHKAQGGQGKG
jgi:hypothetical protein